MVRTALSLVLCGCLLACSSNPVVYSPNDGPNDEASGVVKPLADILQGATAVRLVFVHGVGDHCPGYALDDANGWLNAAAMSAVGLTELPSPDSAPHSVNVSVFMGGPTDPISHVTYTKKLYSLAVPGGTKVTVEAIEITWSQLTQWLKSNQLGYDSPSVTPTEETDTKNCLQPADPRFLLGKPPPPRLLVDRVIKEQVLDRDLADAILYSGTYRSTIERGVAEAFCRATNAVDVPNSNNMTQACIWPAESSSLQPGYKYVFVTHSLGSRIVYDMFLDLLGQKSERNPFSPQEQQAAHAALGEVLAQTAGVYMMANQLTMMGLADVPKDARSPEGMRPFEAHTNTSPSVTSPAARAEPKIGPDASSNEGAPAALIASPSKSLFVQIGEARLAATRTRRAQPSTLHIVSFNDTNDLLTWHIPMWYLVSDADSVAGGANVDFVNVFVQNTTKLLVIESPAAAHDDYFKKKAVWDVIACGAKGKEVAHCQQ
jgi:hypothetical protein